MAIGALGPGRVFGMMMVLWVVVARRHMALGTYCVARCAQLQAVWFVAVAAHDAVVDVDEAGLEIVDDAEVDDAVDTTPNGLDEADFDMS